MRNLSPCLSKLIVFFVNQFDNEYKILNEN